ncbi:unnamed protein product, partial [Polarella glacialis]
MPAMDTGYAPPGDFRSVGRPLHSQADAQDSCGPCGTCLDAPNVVFQATMTVTLTVFIYEGAAYNLIFVNRVLPAMGKESLIVPFFVLFNTVWILALWAYIRAYCSDPGVVPTSWHDFVRSVGPALPVVPSAARWNPGKASYCRKCTMPRPERAHHCNVSGVCVLRMDHYCPWINNCVGVGNYKFFLQLVVYGSLASFIGVTTALPELILCTGTLFGVTDADVFKADILQTSDIIAFLVFGCLAIFLGILLAPMLATHLPLAASNVTAIEGNYDNMVNPYHLGSRIANLEQVLGSFGPDWFLPIKPMWPKGDGISFPRWDEPLGPDDRPIADEEVLQADQLWRVRYR